MDKSYFFYSMSDVYLPVQYHIERWSEDELSRGSWSQLLVHGSPEDRAILGSPFSDNFILAGEACDSDFPAMVHGAVLSGHRAADWAVESLSSSSSSSSSEGGGRVVAVIGAGAAGLAAAGRIRRLRGGGVKVVLLEARDRIGGRIKTINLGGDEGEGSAVMVDAGATWLHHAEENHLVPMARELGLTLVESVFSNALNAAQDGGDAENVYAMIGQLSCEAQRAVIANGNKDMSLESALSSFISSCSKADQRRARMALDEIRADSGIDFNLISAKYALEEPGVGAGDLYMKEGYSALLTAILKGVGSNDFPPQKDEDDGIQVRLNTLVTAIDWSDAAQVKLVTASGKILVVDRCICTLPISLLQPPSIVSIHPPLPLPQSTALSRMKMSTCDKVLLRFERRWWPVSPGGILHWYGVEEKEGAGTNTDWIEWLDLTDGVGAPVVMAFIAGISCTLVTDWMPSGRLYICF